MNRADIIKSIEAYSEASGLAPTTICQYALRNRKVYDRLKSGGSCSVASVEALARWMDENPPKEMQE